ncbi:hypothetical protein THASP1DRAFT_9975, partial [Thamnocephalis sphaerospora]
MINVLVAGGSGQFGCELVQAFLTDDAYHVKVLSRAGSQHKSLDDLCERGVHIATADYSRHEDLVCAMRGTDILVSAIHYRSIEKWQPYLIRAAKDAGVRRVVPALFESDVMQSLTYRDPGEAMRQISDAQLEYTRYNCGWFYNYLATPFIGIDLPHQKATVIGEGNTLISFMLSSDLARFVAASL